MCWPSVAITRAGRDWYDLLGTGIVVALLGWTFVSAVARAANPWPQALLIAGTATAYAVGRILGGRRPVFVPAAVVASILIGVAVSGPTAVSGGPLAPPLGYGNANGSLYAMGVAAAAVVAVLANREQVRIAAGVLVVVFTGLSVLTLSKAAALLAIGILLIAVVAHRLRPWVALAAPFIVLATAGAAIVLGLTDGRLVAPAVFEEVSARRTSLWREAMEISVDEPVFGVGPGMFAQTSPTALANADAQWAHSAYLQMAAETGVIGAALLALVMLWVFGALFRSRQDVRLIVIGTAAVTALAVHAAIDYVAHFPVLMIVAALLAGLASSRDVRVGRMRSSD